MYERKGKVIRNLETGEEQQFSSINKAKEASRKLQGGAMGRGLVKVVQTKQKFIKPTLHIGSKQVERQPVELSKVKLPKVKQTEVRTKKRKLQEDN